MVIYVGNVIAFSGIIDLAFCIDNSGSMIYRNPEELLEAVLDKFVAESVLEAAAVYEYQEEYEGVGEPNAVVIRGRTENYEDIRTSFSEIEFGSGTEYVWSALLYISQFHSWGGARRVILVLTDEPGEDPENKSLAISSCNSNNVDVYAAILYEGPGFEEIEDTCSQTGGDSLREVDYYDGVSNFADRVFNMIFPQ